jgi:hypothetical protein
VPWIAQFGCGDGLTTRLRPNITARITPGDPNSVREFAGSGARLGVIPGGGVFTVLSGPSCDTEGRIWWYVDYNGLRGWTAEGDWPTFWAEPIGLPATPVPPAPQPPATCSPQPRLTIGGTGQVGPGEPNVLRDRPGLNASGSNVIGQLTEGAIFTTLDGPVCRDGYNWWRVTAGGQTGWTAEGEGSIYWIGPIVCANNQIARVAPGMRARVTPGLPQRIRTAPNTNWGVPLVSVPAGGSMFVFNNYQCDPQGRLWWMVAYRGIIGWTAEGDNGVYWIAPA